ncbi:ATP-binding protein [Granulosicoccus sp. 3-233]|uniref:ATP-binding protein n=1 Tax=Granulosicoccus sp. 3-233 TaxID=3417969 RepID=UPI003D332F25
MRLKYQLFLAMLLGSGLLIALMYAINSWSFNRGFLGYINSVEVARIEPIVDDLAANYVEHGGWEWIAASRSRWGAIIDQHLGLPANRRGRPGPGPKPDFPLEHPPASGEGRPAAVGKPPPRDKPERGPGNLTLDPRLLLANADNVVLYGFMGADIDSSETTWLPISVDEHVVGYLGYRLLQQPAGQLDQVFADQQRRGFGYAALAMIALSALLAAALSARIVGPILHIRNSVRRIRKGKYDQHIDMTRRDEIGDLARDINRLAAALDKNLSARQQWLAEISHELRTPVAILQGELEAMLDGVMPIDEPAIRSLHDESLRLSRLINDLHKLTLSDIGALDYRFEVLDLVELIGERCRLAQPLASARSLIISTDFSTQNAFMKADCERMAQLADNLLQNSIRHTDPEGTIIVSIAIIDQSISLCCKDSSPGVTTQQLPHLFEALYRTDASRNRDTGGAGLGLAIVSRIVEAHEGSVEASHSELGGLAITIRFPLHR